MIRDDLLDLAVRGVRFCSYVDRRLSSSSSECECSATTSECRCDEETEALVNDAVRAYLTSQSMLTWVLAVGWVMAMVAYMHVSLWKF